MKKDWRTILGVGLLLLSLFLPLLGFAVPFLPLSTPVKAELIGVLSLGGPEIMIVLAVLCLGKETVVKLKKKFWGFFKLKQIPKPVSKKRYYFGLFCFVFSITPLYLAAYFPEILPKGETPRLLITVSGDLIFVLSFFILGANFWEKFKRLFVWREKPSQRRPQSRPK